MRRLLLTFLLLVAGAMPVAAQNTTIRPYRIAFTTGCSIQSGSGSPEGVVTASVCSIYLRTNGGASTIIYVKETGSGNTGWVAVGGSAGYWLFDQSTPTRKISAFAEYTGTDPGTDLYGMWTEMKIGVSTDFSDFFIGHNLGTNTNTTAGVDIANMTGTYVYAYNQSNGTTGYQSSLTTEAKRFGTGTTTDMFGLDMFASAEASGAVTNLYGIKIYQPTEAGSGAISNNYAIDIDNQAITGSTQNWAIRYNAGVFGVKFDGKVNLNSVEYTFPANNGDAGQVLQTDGSGVLTWATVSGGSGGGGAVAGDVLTVMPTTDETLASSTTLQNDDALLFAAEANTTYFVQLYVNFTSGTDSTIDAGLAWSVPAGATATWGGDMFNTSATSIDASGRHFTRYQSVSQLNHGVISTATIDASPAILVAIVKIGSTSGNVNLQWAQVNSSATNLVRKTDSALTYWKVAGSGSDTNIDTERLARANQGLAIYSGLAPTEDNTGASMDIDVAAGHIRLASGVGVLVTAGEVTLSAAHSTLNRIDLIRVNSSGTLGKTDGTPAMMPSAPSIPAGEIAIATIFVPAGDTAIQTAQITDKRTYTKLPMYFRKTADETVNNSTTLQNDDHLVFPLFSNGVYDFECRLITSATSTTPDFQAQFSVPSGATMNWGSDMFGHTTAANQVYYWAPTITTATPNVLFTQTGNPFWGSNNGTTGSIFSGQIYTSSTAGNVTLQWAQGVANASDSKFLTNSLCKIDVIVTP